MIAAKETSPGDLVARLARRAARIARAWALGRKAAARADGQHWRRPELLWPAINEDF